MVLVIARALRLAGDAKTSNMYRGTRTGSLLYISHIKKCTGFLRTLGLEPTDGLEHHQSEKWTSQIWGDTTVDSRPCIASKHFLVYEK